MNCSLFYKGIKMRKTLLICICFFVRLSSITSYRVSLMIKAQGYTYCCLDTPEDVSGLYGSTLLATTTPITCMAVRSMLPPLLPLVVVLLLLPVSVALR